MIHDSFGVHPSNIDRMIEIVESQFKLIHTMNPLKSLVEKSSNQNWDDIAEEFGLEPGEWSKLEKVSGHSMIG